MVYWDIEHLREDLGTELAGSVLVMTSGCYDIFHLGHVCMLEFCAKLGDLVIVIVNGDASVHELKGEYRPIQMAAYRAGVVDACGHVDHVLIWQDSNMIPAIRELEPRYWVKGNRNFDDVLEADHVFKWGGDVICYWNHLRSSTTEIVGKIIAAEGTTDRQVSVSEVSTPVFVTPYQLRVAAHQLEKQVDIEGDRQVGRFYLEGMEFIYTRGGKLDNGEPDAEHTGGDTDAADTPGEGAGEEAEEDVPF
jgi:rfaE bifunctional protein nucleotidyltransferase chain/domain